MAAITLRNVTKSFGHVKALNDVSFSVEDGEFFAILGPPGAGKTTTLRTIVGLETPDAGDVLIDGERVNDVWPGDRDISIVFQNLALYPDKSVFENIAFPLRRRNVAKSEIKRRVTETAALLRIEHLLDRKPAKLSGGERQRVALGRAMVREPRAYLFDEPISALDALLRLEMRTELKRLHHDLSRTLVYVTHDQVEALSMADRIAVLREGVIQQIASPETIYGKPANRFVATVIGSPPMNFLDGTLHLRGESFEVHHPGFALRGTVDALGPGRDAGISDGSPCWIGVRPEDVEIVSPSHGTIRADVYETEPLGGETVLDLAIGGILVKAIIPPTVRIAIRDEVGVRLDPRRLHIFTSNGAAAVAASAHGLTIEPRTR